MLQGVLQVFFPSCNVKSENILENTKTSMLSYVNNKHGEQANVLPETVLVCLLA